MIIYCLAALSDI